MSYFGFGGPPQQYNRQPYGQEQQSSGFFGFGGSEKLNQQTIPQILLQVRQQGVPQQSAMQLEEVLNEMVMNGTEKVSNILKQFISPELAAQVLNEVALEDLEDDMQGGPQGRGMDQRQGRGMEQGRGRGMDPRMDPRMGRQGSGRASFIGQDLGPNYGNYGGKKRRTRGRKQRGGNHPFEPKSLATTAEGFSGGRRRKTRGRKH